MALISTKFVIHFILNFASFYLALDSITNLDNTLINTYLRKLNLFKLSLLKVLTNFHLDGAFR